MTSYDLLLSSLNLIYNLYYIHEIVNLSRPARCFEESQEKQFMSTQIQEENLKMGKSFAFHHPSSPYFVRNNDLVL